MSGALLAGFLEAHPHVRLDLVLSDEALDIVAEGYDAGVRLGEVIDRDRVAVPARVLTTAAARLAGAPRARRPPTPRMAAGDGAEAGRAEAGRALRTSGEALRQARQPPGGGAKSSLLLAFVLRS